MTEQAVPDALKRLIPDERIEAGLGRVLAEAAEQDQKVAPTKADLERAERAAYERGVAEGLHRANNAITWNVTCLGCADKLDGLIRERAAGYTEGVAEGRRIRAEQVDALTHAAYEDGKGDGRAECRAVIALAVPVLAYVSRGWRFTSAGDPYPDARARRALGALDDAGLLPAKQDGDDRG